MLIVNCAPGDVLVQAHGFPWPQLAWAATGMPYPHSQLVTRVEPILGDEKAMVDPAMRVWIVEDHDRGVYEKPAWNLDWFEVWRPLCSDEIKAQAIALMLAHGGEAYGIEKLLRITAFTRLGLLTVPADYDDARHDHDPMVCSEIVARSYWRAGYDLVPGVSNRITLPGELRNPATCQFIGMALA